MEMRLLFDIWSPANLPPGRVPGKKQKPAWPKSEAGDRGADLTGDHMAGKLTPKQEGFCLDYSATGNASEAYRRNYDVSRMTPASINRKAVELLENGKIAARIEELRKPIREKACLTLEEHLQTLQNLRDKADKAGQFTAAITAETNRGKASGLYVDKSENKTTFDGSITVKHELPPEALDILRDLDALPEDAQ